MKCYAQNPRLLSKTVHQNPRTLITWGATYNADNKRAQSPSRRRVATAILRFVRGLTSARARSCIPRRSGNCYRPILFSNDTTVVSMAYDYKGRRFEYKETVNSTLTRHERYLYRGYLQLAMLDMLNSASVKHAIVWDANEPEATRPLSLQVSAHSYFYSFDQVKNVTELFDPTGALAATYDYSPFGQITSALIVGSSMLIVASNPLTFSSEVSDPTLGLQYYNYRHLNSLDGRWVNRDPIEDDPELYLFVRNMTPVEIDGLGLLGITVNYYYDVPEKDFIEKDVGGDTLVQEWKAHTKEGCAEWLFLKARFVYKQEIKIRVRVKIGEKIERVIPHENVHVAIASSWARKYDSFIKPYVDECFCPGCFLAVERLLNITSIP